MTPQLTANSSSAHPTPHTSYTNKHTIPKTFYPSLPHHRRTLQLPSASFFTSLSPITFPSPTDCISGIFFTASGFTPGLLSSLSLNHLHPHRQLFLHQPVPPMLFISMLSFFKNQRRFFLLSATCVIQAPQFRLYAHSRFRLLHSIRNISSANVSNQLHICTKNFINFQVKI